MGDLHLRPAAPVTGDDHDALAIGQGSDEVEEIGVGWRESAVFPAQTHRFERAPALVALPRSGLVDDGSMHEPSRVFDLSEVPVEGHEGFLCKVLGHCRRADKQPGESSRLGELMLVERDEVGASGPRRNAPLHRGCPFAHSHTYPESLLRFQEIPIRCPARLGTTAQPPSSPAARSERSGLLFNVSPIGSPNYRRPPRLPAQDQSEIRAVGPPTRTPHLALATADDA